jgi:hypothetical protein
MVPLMVDERFDEAVRLLAAEQNTPVESLLWQMLQHYVPQHDPVKAREALVRLNGVIDDDVTDGSMTVRETMEAYYREKYGNPD